MKLDKVTVEVSQPHPTQRESNGNPIIETLAVDVTMDMKKKQVVRIKTSYPGWTITGPEGGLVSVLGLAKDIAESSQHPVEKISFADYNSLTNQDTAPVK